MEIKLFPQKQALRKVPGPETNGGLQAAGLKHFRLKFWQRSLRS